MGLKPAFWLTQVGGKQPGRRFGPPPRAPWGLNDAVIVTQPLTTDAREANYRRQTGRVLTPIARGFLSEAAFRPQAYAEAMGLTPRQRRRSWHKAKRVIRLAAALPIQRESVEREEVAA